MITAYTAFVSILAYCSCFRQPI